ncbi:TonB-dependent receptor [Chitinophaga sp. G-6-1-13]|uniref:TonB-dependent receptor n=1 Tax=Chitinophaga fulva TaxID=2728842 RepID=A0A848GHU9_9BACT|nr:TonB-dependent receptor [Chitinophaga fulva]NML38024.1 TonB-dependent receptor [Chitinophaga fulva]
MKKSRFGGASYALSQTVKLLLMMKLCFVVVLLSCLHASATVFSQEKFTLTFVRTDADKIFAKIQQESDYRFFYNYTAIRQLGKIDLQVKDAPLAEIMRRMLDSSALAFRIVDNNLVVISPKSEQNAGRVNGKVADEKGTPLVGVSVKVKGSSQGAVTDIEGRFSLQAGPGAVLVISYMGFISQEVPVPAGEQLINIVLKESTSGLNEVVVIGYGTQRKKDVTGAISSVNSKDLRNVPVRNAAEALQGKVSGVTVSQSSGSPGSAPVVRIRGIGSISGSNTPLYIVDGLPQTDIGWLNPNDIEAMDILKDASTAAIYGSRGSNGVVIITTRKGSRNDTKMHVTLDTYTGWQSAWKRPHMLNAADFIKYKTQAYSADGAPLPTDINTPEKVAQVLKFVNDNSGPNGTDWWKEVIQQNAPIQSYNVGVSGAGKNLVYASSAGYMKQQGIVKGSDYERLSWRTNVTADISTRVKLTTNFGLIYENRRNVDENNPFSGTIFSAMAADPITPVYRNNLKSVPDFYQRIMTGYEANNPYSQYAGILFTNKPNPVAQVERMQQSVWEGIAIKGGAALDVKIIEPLTFRSNFGMDLGRGISKGFSPAYFLNSFDYATYNTVSNSSSWSNYFVWENTLNFDKTFGKHHITALAGISAELTKGLSYAASKQNIVNNEPDMRIIDAATLNPGASGYTYSSALQSFFGRINYVYADRYILAANVRRDGSSNFGDGYRWGTFPSASAAWRFSEENFIKNANLGWLTSGKLRASYGAIGNQYVNTSGLYLSTYGNTYFRYLFGNANTGYLGAERKTMANPSLQWETSKQTDIALDLTLWDGILDVTVDYFNKKVTNMLVVVPIPSTMGYPSGDFWTNAGSMVNKGWEVSLGHSHHFGDFSYNVRLNVSTFRNEVLSMGGGEPIYTTAHLGETISKTEVGKPVGYYFGWLTDGIFQTQDEVDKSPQRLSSRPGDIRFKDINGVDANGNIVPGPDGKLDAADRTMIGNPWPDFVYGLNINLNYKRFDLGMFWQGSQGNDVMNILRYDTESGTGWYNAPQGFLEKSWNGPGSTNKYFRISSNSALNSSVSNYFVEDGSYLRLKNIQLGYNFPEKWLQRARIPQLRLYVGAQNLLTFTKYSGLDPEMGNADPRLIGIDQGYFPQARTFMVGVNAKF